MHTYTPEVVESQVKMHGEDKVIRVVAEGIRRAGQNNPEFKMSKAELMKTAKEHLKTIRGLTDETDQFMPGLDARSKHRREMDLSAEEDGFTLVDLFDRDIAQMSEKYSHRVSGLTGLSKSTGGLVNSDIAWDSLKKAAVRRSKVGQAAKDNQLLEDTYALMMGKPTRGGLPSYARSLRDMAVITQMGNLGLNEIMEAGLTMTKSVMSIARNPEVTELAYNAARGGKRTKELMEDIVSITGLTDAMEKLERYASHLDVTNPADTKLGRSLDTAAHYMTGGNLLPTAKRWLAKTTGFNMARRAKYRLAQMSMLQDLAKAHNGGQSLTNKARLRDLGLDSDTVAGIFNDPNKVVYGENGLVERVLVDNLTTAEKDALSSGLYRAASQDVQKHIVGELPPYLNNPLWAVVLQYLSFPLVATNKQLARNAQFADMEALTGVMLNLIVTGTVQEAMIQLGLRNEEEFEKNTYKYYSSLGILPDVSMLLTGEETPSVDRIPIYSVMENYADLAGETASYVMSAGEDEMSFNDIKPLLYMNNHATLRAMVNIYQGEIGRLAEQANEEAAFRKKAAEPLKERDTKQIKFDED
jgi:hypothetical protein